MSNTITETVKRVTSFDKASVRTLAMHAADNHGDRDTLEAVAVECAARMKRKLEKNAAAYIVDLEITGAFLKVLLDALPAKPAAKRTAK